MQEGRFLFYVTTDGQLRRTPQIGQTVKALGWVSVLNGTMTAETYLRFNSGEGPDITAHLDQNTLGTLARLCVFNSKEELTGGSGIDTQPLARNVEVTELKRGQGSVFQKVALGEYAGDTIDAAPVTEKAKSEPQDSVEPEEGEIFD